MTVTKRTFIKSGVADFDEIEQTDAFIWTKASEQQHVTNIIYES